MLEGKEGTVHKLPTPMLLIICYYGYLITYNSYRIVSLIFCDNKSPLVFRNLYYFLLISTYIGPMADMITGGLQSATANNAANQTVREYDMSELNKLSTAVMFEILTVSYLHFVTKAGKPLLFIPLMGIMNKVGNIVTVQLMLLTHCIHIFIVIIITGSVCM